MKQTVWMFSALLLTLASLSVAGDQAPPQRVKGASPTQVSAILVDVVVRDKRGDPVRGLTADDFELYEDGQKQQLGSFTPIFQDAPAPVLASTAAAPVAAAGGAAPTVPAASLANAPEVIALVFDRLSADSRPLAHTAAVKYLGDKPLSNNYLAVYAIDLHLMTLQNFTRDTGLIRKAVDEFAAHSSSSFGSYRESKDQGAQQEQQRLDDAMSSAEQAAAAGGPGAGQAMANMAGAAAQQQFASMQASMEQTFEALERDQAGYASANALLAVVNGMRAIPGRKSIVFFSEGLSIPPNVVEQFRSVIAMANRANVSIYPMDAMGLRAESTQATTRDEMMEHAQEVLRRNGRDRPGPAMMAALERNEDLLRMDPQAGLGELADETGGFLIANTNDLRSGFERIETDMRNYYLLTYVPSNDNFDGAFRTISVKVKRPGVTVHSRKGYFALRDTSGMPVKNYEAPALVALEKRPVPNAFPVRASVLRFPEQDHPNRLSVVVELGTEPITFEPAPDKKTYQSDFTVLVRFTDDSRQVVDKLSQRYEVTGPIDQIDRARSGRVMFYREPELPPGTYTMEAVVYDSLSKKSSVRFSTVEQPPVDPDQVRLSTVVLVGGGEKVPDTQKAEDNPLFVGQTMIYPNLAASLKKDVDKELAFFFTAYRAAGSTAPLSGTIEILQNAKVLARVPLQLSDADAAGRIKQVSRLPIQTLDPGSYQLRVRVTQGDKSIARLADFRIVS